MLGLAIAVTIVWLAWLFFAEETGEFLPIKPVGAVIGLVPVLACWCLYLLEIVVVGR